MFVILTGQII